MGHLGLIGLLVAVVVGVLAPVIGGLNRGSAGHESVRLEPGASVLLIAHHEVTLDSGDGSTAIEGCAIAGPGNWSHVVKAAGSTTAFRTGPRGDYRITCQGGAVEVENDDGGHAAADVSERHGRRITIGMFAIAGVIGLASLGLLIAGSRRRMADAPDRAGVQSETDVDRPELR